MQADPTGGQTSNRLEDRALGYLRIPARAAKPRSPGRTIVADRGLGSHAQEGADQG